MNAKNTKNINRLADFIESEKYDFDMCEGEAEPKCGSAGCIGGQAAVLWPDIRDGGSLIFTWDCSLLADKLGISRRDESDLCHLPTDARGEKLELHQVTRKAAVECLRNLAKTGRVRFKRSLCKRVAP